MKLTNSTYYFVHEHHPVIKLVYNNQKQLGSEIDEQHKINGSWYRIADQLFEDSCNTLDTQVFRNTPHTFDFTKLSVTLSNPDGDWLQHPGCANGDDRNQAYKDYCSTPLYLRARIQFDYCIPLPTEDQVPNA